MERIITRYKLISMAKFGDNDALDVFERDVSKMIRRGWEPLGGPARTAICRGRLTVEEHTIVQAMVQYEEPQTLDFLIDK
mgnify:CR=1 FL=1